MRPQRVLRLAGGPGVAVVGDRDLAVAHPDRHSAEEPAAFAHGEQRVKRAPVQQPVIAGLGLQADGGDAGEEPVEERRRTAFERGLTGAPPANRVYDVAAGAPLGQHVGDELGRVLQIRVEHHDGVAAGVVEARRECQLVAEVARVGK